MVNAMAGFVSRREELAGGALMLADLSPSD
jgi:hypothetical protein